LKLKNFGVQGKAYGSNQYKYRRRVITNQEFRKVINMGLGSAILELQKNENNEQYRNAVLYAATHNTCYDAQVEGSRRDYLFDAIKLSGDSCFLEKIIECFHKPKDFHLSSQLRGLLYRFWENGYDKAEPETNNNN